MAKKLIRDPKTRALRQEAALHLHPEQVTDELFSTQECFDPRDLVQVKYEMLRRVQSEGQTVSRAAANFGFYNVGSVKGLCGRTTACTRRRAPFRSN